MVERSALLRVGGFDETLASRADWDLWLRLAQAGHRFAAVRTPLVIKHEHAAPQLSTDPLARFRGFAGVDRKWGAIIRRRVGPAAYRRFKAASLANVQYAHWIRARANLAAGQHRAVLQDCLAMCRLLPWSRKFLLYAIALIVLRPAGYRLLARATDRLRRHPDGPVSAD
jgi:GT2 family glycosyltransferase